MSIPNKPDTKKHTPTPEEREAILNAVFAPLDSIPLDKQTVDELIRILDWFSAPHRPEDWLGSNCDQEQAEAYRLADLLKKQVNLEDESQ